MARIDANMAERSKAGVKVPIAAVGKRVLVVEDDVNIRESVRQLLAYEGYEVITAADGSEALTQAQQASPDVIILDLGLPSADPGGGQFDGFGVMKWLDLRLPRRIPVIVLTARQDEETRRQAEALGASVFLTKPFRQGDLAAALRDVMRGQQTGT